MTDAQRTADETSSQRRRRFARAAGVAVVVAGLASYALAWLAYTRDQVPSAVVIAVFGYLLLRSRHAIVARLTRARFGRGAADFAADAGERFARVPREERVNR